MRQVDVARVSAIYPERCTARVLYEDKGEKEIPSRELEVMTRGAQGTKDYWMPEIGELVVCLFLPNTSKKGFIIGTPYNDIDTPPVDTEKKRRLQFKDGTYVEYDIETKEMTVNLHADGVLNVKGKIIADEFVTRANS